MGRDESGTLARLREHRKLRFDPTLARHGGRLVKQTGDGALAEFPSAVDALGAAIEFQQAMAEANRDQPDDTAIVFRIGLHLGDLIVDGDDLYGDGVNVAARLEGEAPAGGIVISRPVHEAVDGRLKAVMHDVGDLALKNIERPVRAFRVEWNAADWQAPVTAAATPPDAPLTLPEKPSIAVLPFQNMSGDPEQEYFADGMVEDIITALSRFKSLFVIARNSTFTYKGRAVDVRQVGRDLGVRYVLEGSIRKGGARLRITGQLVEAASGAHLWADRFEGALQDIFTLQDEITARIVAALEPSLRQAEIARARRKPPNNLDAYDLYLRALPFVATAMPEDADKALRLLDDAIRLEPDYAVVHGFMAWCHEQRYLRGGLREEAREAARRHAHAAIKAGVDDAMALAMGGFVVGVVERDYDTAMEAIDRSLSISPSSALAFGFSAIIRAWIGDDATAIEHARLGIRLSPYDPLIYLPYVGLAYAQFFAGSYAEAASAARRASQANPRFSVPCYLQAAALVRLGRLEEAKATAGQLLELQPGFTIGGMVAGNVMPPERMTMLADALRLTGLPE